MTTEVTGGTGDVSADTTSTTQETVETNDTSTTVPNGETPSTETPPAKKYKVKVDNDELEVDEEELLRGYAHNKAANKRMKEAAERRKQAEEFIDLVKKDPRKLLTHPEIGVDVKQFAEQILSEYMQEQLMTPEEKETREMKARLAQYEAEKKAQEEEQQRQLFEQATAKAMEEFDRQFTEALSTSGLPKTNQTVSRLAYYMQQAIAQGYSNVTVKDVVPLVKEDYLNDIKELFGSANDDVLMQLLGDQIGERVSKAQMNKIKAAQKQVAAKVEDKDKDKPKPAERERTNGQRKYMTRDEWRATIAERAGYKPDL